MKGEAKKVVGYMPEDVPPPGAMISLGIQQVLTMFPATVLVAILTKFDVGVTLLASGLGTIIALLVAKRRIPMYYGSSFSYIAVIVTTMSLYAKDCFTSTATVYCPEGVRIVQVGIIGTAVVEILVGLLIMRSRQSRTRPCSSPRHHRQRGHRHRRRPGRFGPGHGRRTLGHRLRDPVRHRCLLRLSAGQGTAGHAAHPARRHRRLHRGCAVGPGQLRCDRAGRMAGRSQHHLPGLQRFHAPGAPSPASP